MVLGTWHGEGLYGQRFSNKTPNCLGYSRLKNEVVHGMIRLQSILDGKEKADEDQRKADAERARGAQNVPPVDTTYTQHYSSWVGLFDPVRRTIGAIESSIDDRRYRRRAHRRRCVAPL